MCFRTLVQHEVMLSDMLARAAATKSRILFQIVELFLLGKRYSTSKQATPPVIICDVD